MNINKIKNAIRNVPDFPKAGIQFKDITTALRQPDIFHELIDALADAYKNQHVDFVVGIESRGFIFGAALAYALGCGFVPMRKPGKLPAEVISQEYALEYGIDTIEIHKDALTPGSKVLIIDDLLATGGTAEAAALLVRKVGAELIGLAFAIELDFLNGRQKLEQYAPVNTLVHF